MKKTIPGFTIVELLIVIVVIAVLAAITIVAFNGVQDRARKSAASSSSTQSAKKIKVWQVDNEGLSPDCPKFYELVTGTTVGAPPNPVSPAICTFSYKDTSYQYTPSTTVAGGYCVTTTVVNQSYKVSEATSATSGGCNGHGQGGVNPITNLVTNPSFRVNATGWIGSSATVSRVASPWSADGNGALQVAATGQDSFAQTTVPVQAGQAYTIVGTVNLQVAQTGTFQGSTQQRNLFAAFHDSSGTYIGGGGGVSSVPSNSPGTYQLRVTGTAPAGSAQLRLRLYNGATSGNTVYWDQIMVVAGNYTGGYADGETTNWTWNGVTANDATSTGPPQ